MSKNLNSKESFDIELNHFRHWLKDEIRKRAYSTYELEFQIDMALNRLYKTHQDELEEHFIEGTYAS